MSGNIILRPATLQDNEFIAPIVYETMGYGTLMLGTDSKKECLRRIRKIFLIPGHRLSYDGTLILEENNKKIGYIMAYPYHEVLRRDRRFAWILIRLNGIPGFLRLLFTHWTLLVKEECKRGEFLLSALGIAQYQQNLGYARQMIEMTLEYAWSRDYRICALVVDRDNIPALKLYQKMGFKVESTCDCDGHLISRMIMHKP